MSKNLFLLYRIHPASKDEFFDQGVSVRVTPDTPGHLKRLQESMKCLSGSCVVVRGEIIDSELRPKTEEE